MSYPSSTLTVLRPRAPLPNLFGTQAAQPAIGRIVVRETGEHGPIRGLLFQLTGVSATLTDNAGQSGASFDLWTHALGNVAYLAAVGRIGFTSTGGVPPTAGNVALSLGTAANATNNGTLATTEQNIIPTTNTPTLSAGAGTWVGALTTPAGFDGTSTASVLRLNIGIPTGLTGNGTLVLTGGIFVQFVNVDVSQTNPLEFA
jgi:hypothetical protein